MGVLTRNTRRDSDGYCKGDDIRANNFIESARRRGYSIRQGERWFDARNSAGEQVVAGKRSYGGAWDFWRSPEW